MEKEILVLLAILTNDHLYKQVYAREIKMLFDMLRREQAGYLSDTSRGTITPAEEIKWRDWEYLLSTRTKNVLQAAGWKLEFLTEKTERDVLELQGAGQKTLKEIKKYLGEYGLILKQHIF
jgi:DNA-directed RNA polymerase alpha subunit